VRCPQFGERGEAVQKLLREKLSEHARYVRQHGQDMPEVLHWKWRN